MPIILYLLYIKETQYEKSKSNLTGGKSKGLPLPVVTLLYLLFTSNPTQAIVRYIAIDLGSVPGLPYSHAHSINNHGLIVGEVFDSSGGLWHAVLFDISGEGNNIDLGTLGGRNSCAESINESSQIVGGAYSAEHKGYNAVLFDVTGDGNNITLDINGYAESINEEGQIVGAKYCIEDGNKIAIASMFDLEGGHNTTILGKLSGYRQSVALCINNRGQIVGASANGWYEWDLDCRATLFDPNGVNNIDLGTLGGANSAAYSINDHNQIVGAAEDANGYVFATLFDPTGEGNNVKLGTVVGFGASHAISINNKGQIVGKCETFGFPPVAVLFDGTGAGNNINLNNLINPALDLTLLRADCINDNGWIVCKSILLKPAAPGDSEPDRDVDLKDFAIFTAAWRSTPADNNWNQFCDISEPEDGSIDEKDLAVFAENYLMPPP